jgi:hypothetical protein
MTTRQTPAERVRKTARQTRQTPGERLRKLIDSGLADGCSWTEQEQVSIDKATKAEDRAAALQKLLDVELNQPQPSSRKATELAGEIRQLEALVVRLVRELIPDPEAIAVSQASKRHQNAVNARWARHAHRKAQ